MEDKIYQPLHGGEWGIAIQYFQDGVLHVPLMDFVQPWTEYGSDEENELDLNCHFRYALDKPYEDYLVFSLTPRERVEGFVYGGTRVKRSCALSPEIEQEFVEIEKTLHNYDPNNPGYIREIWKYSFRQTWRGIKTYTEHPDGKCTVIKSPLETTK
jgi:hypothetical protein